MPINTKLAAPEVEFIFNHSEAKGLIYDERLEDVLTTIGYPFQHIVGLEEMKDVIKTIQVKEKLSNWSLMILVLLCILLGRRVNQKE